MFNTKKLSELNYYFEKVSILILIIST